MTPTARPCLIFLICLSAFSLCRCGGEDGPNPGKNGPAQTIVPVAQVAMDGGALALRQPGESGFTRWDGKTVIGQGTTIRSGSGIVSLNFMGSIEVQLSKESELILEGAVRTARGPNIVLGLKMGEVRVNSSADCPVILKTPAGEVTGVRSFFTADLRHSKDEGYAATVKALSPNIFVKNNHGSLKLDSWGWVKIDENGPPTMLKDLKRPSRK